MTLSSGSKLGPYEILSPLGAGGMGEVYRAKDTRLDRTVAIKILPQRSEATAEMRQRFEREARAVSSLNHPHICALYDIGREGDTDYLVMEFIEGETLAERLKRGPLPLAELLRYATEIADALERAHRQGIVHRDLKPGNVMLTKSGAKLLDFGLAKPGGAMVLSGETLTISPAGGRTLTAEGTIVGTVQYMSPEQLEGKEADARSDIFSFGAVVYEMATGKRAFEGKSHASLIAAILEHEPAPISQVQPMTPPGLERVVKTCLAKEPEERFQSAHDLKLQLGWLAEGGSQAGIPAPTAQPAGIAKRKLHIICAGASVLIVASALLGYLAGGRNKELPLHVQVALPEKIVFDAMGDYGGAPVLSPQGDRIAFSAHGADGGKALWVRPLDSFSAQRIAGTEDAAHPFWSPDGRYLGFFAKGKLSKVLASGGPVVSLADAADPRGGAWCGNDVLLFAPSFMAGIMKVNAGGGTATPVTTVDGTKHTTHRWPSCLPDSRHFLYFATNHQGGRPEDNGIYYASFDGKENRMVVQSDAGGQYASGYLLFHLQTSVMAQRFDPSTGKLSGEPAAVQDKVKYDTGVWRTLFSASENGTLGFFSGGGSSKGSQLVWCDRSGKIVKVIGETGSYSVPKLSPDGRQVAFLSGDPAWDVWTIDMERGVRSRITFSGGANVGSLTWSPDGKEVAYGSGRTDSKGAPEIVVEAKPANGAGEARLLTAGEGDKSSHTFPQYSPDGKYLVYLLLGGMKALGIYAKPLHGDGETFPVVSMQDKQAAVAGFQISPNGKWIAYDSNESGKQQIYIAPFPRGEGKWQVSVNGGILPVWRGDGKELFFSIGSSSIWAASVSEAGGELRLGTPQLLFQTNGASASSYYDVAKDGQHFLVNYAGTETNTELNLIFNWTKELEQK